MFTIVYKKFDENGYFKGEKQGTKKYTKRAAIETLKRNGFYTTDTRHKLPACFTNGRGTNAYII